MKYVIDIPTDLPDGARLRYMTEGSVVPLRTTVQRVVTRSAYFEGLPLCVNPTFDNLDPIPSNSAALMAEVDKKIAAAIAALAPPAPLVLVTGGLYRTRDGSHVQIGTAWSTSVDTMFKGVVMEGVPGKEPVVMYDQGGKVLFAPTPNPLDIVAEVR